MAVTWDLLYFACLQEGPASCVSTQGHPLQSARERCLSGYRQGLGREAQPGGDQQHSCCCIAELLLGQGLTGSMSRRAKVHRIAAFGVTRSPNRTNLNCVTLPEWSLVLLNWAQLEAFTQSMHGLLLMLILSSAELV